MEKKKIGRPKKKKTVKKKTERYKDQGKAEGSKKTQFSSDTMKGNSNAKKDFTRDMAKRVTWNEINHAANMITSVPYNKLREMVASKELDNESLLTYSAIKKAVKGDFKPLQWLVEMTVGKPLQQVEQTINEHTIGITITKEDADL